MIKYLGITALVLSLTIGWFLDQRITDIKVVINDHVDYELQSVSSNVYYLKQLYKREDTADSLFNIVLELFNSVQESNPFSDSIRIELLRHFKERNIDYNASSTNMSLLNNLCNKLISVELSKTEREEYKLIVSDVELFENDSMDIRIKPFRKVGEEVEIDYYHNNILINTKALQNFKGEMSDLEAVIINPITCKAARYRGI